jgi:hypothetical protein
MSICILQYIIEFYYKFCVTKKFTLQIQFNILCHHEIYPSNLPCSK